MVEKDAVRRAYDELADVYAAHRSANGTGRGSELLSAFLESLPDSPAVLDAGCGQGDPVLRELSASSDAYGVDISREQLRLASDAAPEAALAQGDVTRLPVADGTFDAVVAYWSLIHVPLEEHQTVLEEFARVLRPGGRVLLCEGTNEWVGENPDWLDSGVGMAWEIAGPEATREHLRTAGFEILDEWGVPESLEDDEEESEAGDAEEADAEEADEDHPWTFFSARLEE